jgi:hypothetical protein
MQHIKDYVSKIETILTSRNKDVKKSKGSGLLAPTKQTSSGNSSELDIVANFVQGIRTAKEEMKNGNN